jgi:hypothetical protein
MTAQPTGPAHGPDPGSYEVIHPGGHAAAGVPLADFMRLRALQRVGSAPEREDAEDTAALQEWRAREAAGRISCAPADEVWQRLGLTRCFRVTDAEKAIGQVRGSSLRIPPVSARCWTPPAGWPVIPARPGRPHTDRRTRGGCGPAGRRSTVTGCRSGTSPGGKPAGDLPLTPAPGISAAQGYPGGASRRLPGPLLRPR